ncbi:purine-cytosine permease family protein [Nocardia sp. alder85J]|uniref:purine-cytosine permease family protein n=1 Tax=Nocardia sp. alder85J TaxID=2862949 RepID=UPI001CD3E9C4|nr:cytosine permease [Nocardia sp. alder85J]MCX4096995.1 cytosine permease [Nocardia sp. alder85J]
MQPRDTTSPRPLAVETRGIDVIPADERRGSPFHLSGLWGGAVLNPLTVVYGVMLVTFGLSPWQCVLAILIGNLTWILTGLCSLTGPAAGTSTFVISRNIMGRWGNRPLALLNWLMQVGYEVLDLVLMVLAVTALLDLAGVHLGLPAKLLVTLVLSLAQSALPLFGHAAIMRTVRMLIGPFAAGFLVLAYLTADRVHIHDLPTAGWSAFLGGIALVASGSGLGWTPNSADFSRYLPERTGRRGVVAAVALGAGLPQIVLMLVGVGVGLVTPAATDPVSGLPGAFPSWFTVPFLLLLIVQLGALNGMNLYSSGLTLQSAGVPLNRIAAVLLDSAVCLVLAGIVLSSNNFNQALSNFLLFMIVWFAPWSAILMVDYFLRRGRYPRDGLERPIRWSRAGVAAQLLGSAASALFLVTTIWQGPIAKALGGLDFSVFAGLLVGGFTYWLFARSRYRVPTAEVTTADAVGVPA